MIYGFWYSFDLRCQVVHRVMCYIRCVPYSNSTQLISPTSTLHAHCYAALMLKFQEIYTSLILFISSLFFAVDHKFIRCSYSQIPLHLVPLNTFVTKTPTIYVTDRQALKLRLCFMVGIHNVLCYAHPYYWQVLHKVRR